MPSLPVVGHVVQSWLPASATFIHTLIRNQHGVRPVVLTDRVTRAAEFPVDELVDIGVASGGLRRRAQRLRARRAGLESPWELRLARAARAHGCVALHAHFGWVGHQALAVARHLEVPLVTTFYGFDLAVPDREAGWREAYDQLFAEGAAFVVEGPHMAETLAGIGAPRDRIHVVRIGLDLDLFPFEPRVPGRPLILLQTGRLIPKKGVDVSIRAFAAARPRLDDAELWIVGDGPERAALEELASELGVSDGVRFLGALPYEDYRATVARAHVCMQPSRTAADGDSEGGAPTVILEMQASGMPVVATRHADIPFVVARPDELVEEEDADGLAERLVELAGLSAEEWRARAVAARALMEREHDARRQAARVEQLYDLGTSNATSPPLTPPGMPSATNARSL